MNSSAKFALLLSATALLPTYAFAQGAGNSGANASSATTRSMPGQTGMTAADLKDQTVYTSANREVGTIDHVVLDNSGTSYAAIELADSFDQNNRMVLVPVARLDRQGDRLTVNGYKASQIKQMSTFNSGNGSYRDAPDSQRVDLASSDNGMANDQTSSQIVVRQRAPTVSLDQAAPQITVRQPQPRVTVRQPQPQITVRQAPPTITVDQPQPEITVRMPKPDVSVAMAQPQVQVRMPQPQVQVQQPQGQAQVQLERAQPRVQVQANNNQPDIDLQQQGQPQVQYERSGQPRVVYRQAQGQPTVRYEQMNDQNNQNATNQTGSQSQSANADGTSGTQRTAMNAGSMNAASMNAASTNAEQDRSATDQQMLRQKLGVGDVDNTASVANPRSRPVSVGDLTDMSVYNARGEDLGGVERVIVNPTTNRRYVVLSSGGFLGFGADHVAFPLERFQVNGDHLVIRGVTESDIGDMNNWKQQVSNYRTLNDSQNSDLRVWQG